MSEDSIKEPKIVYITSRAGDHPIHIAYADSVGSDYEFIDFRLPWHAKKTSKFQKYLSWLVCSLSFPNKRKYDLFIVSGQHIMPALMKVFFQFRKDQKLICLHANEGLFFVKSKKYRLLNRSLVKFALSKYDAHICIGEFQTNLLNDITKGKAKNTFTIRNGIKKSKHESLIKLSPNLASKQILFIGHLYAGWRTWYKGIDLMINTIKELIIEGNNITFKIIGNYTSEFEVYFKSTIPKKFRNKIILSGPSYNIETELADSSLYLHCARGDAFPTTTIEAISAGVPCLVSELTGTKEIINKINSSFVVKSELTDIKERIKEYYKLDLKSRQKISERCKEISKKYILEDKIQDFKNIIHTINNLH